MQFTKLSQKEYMRLSQEEKQKYREAEVQNTIKDKKFIVKPFIYKGSQKEVFLECQCLVCGTEWKARYDVIVSQGSGCRKCVNDSNKLDIEEVKRRLDKVSKGRWSYRFLKPYEHYSDIIEITCNTCGNVEYPQINNTVNHNKGCIKCNKVATPTYEEIIEQLDIVSKEGNYTYKKFSKEEYKNVTNLKVECKCDICGHEWKARAGLLKGKSKTKCKSCALKSYPYISKPEKEIVEYIKSFYKGKIVTSDRTIIPSPVSNFFYEIDILLTEIKLAIEFNGRYWHTDYFIKNKSKGYFKTADEYHDYKTNKCLEKGITLLHIAEEDYLKDKESVLQVLKQNIAKYLDK